MDYVREHIKRYWGIVYKRTLGVSFVTFAVALAMGLTFTALTESLAIINYVNYFLFWAVLIIISALVFISNFLFSHISSVKYMYEEEHAVHSKHMAIWMASIVVGVLVFFLPLLFARSYMEPIVLLFAFGGIFWVLYITIFVIFKHRYNELAIGGSAAWLMFILGLAEFSRAQLSISTWNSFSLYFAAMSITVVSGFVGVALLFNSGKDSMKEFVSDMKRIELDEMSARKKRAAAGRRRR